MDHKAVRAMVLKQAELDLAQGAECPREGVGGEHCGHDHPCCWCGSTWADEGGEA